mmetsp:Transcript_15822/g.36192  ORF Transcript_15822/g.36192 Transcript_15822/m.36192 type:complete len:328 (-) Transcript_15822:231-1214(-)
MMLVNQYQFCDYGGSLQACRDLAKKLHNLDTPKAHFFTVEHLYISTDDTVKYTMRVQCSFLDVSWTLAAHRYSDFEQLHKSAACITKAELPPKHLLLASRLALLHRAAGLQSYCNELLQGFCEELLQESAAPCRAEVMAFFELDRMNVHLTRASTVDKQAAAIEKLKRAYRAFVANEGKKFVSSAATKSALLSVKQAFRSSKRTPFEQCPSNVEHTAASASKRMRSSPVPTPAPSAWERLVEKPKPPLSAWERLVQQPTRPQTSGLPPSSEQKIISPVSPPMAESSVAASPWSADMRGEDQAKSIDPRGVRFQRSGISDVVGLIALE